VGGTFGSLFKYRAKRPDGTSILTHYKFTHLRERVHNLIWIIVNSLPWRKPMSHVVSKPIIHSLSKVLRDCNGLYFATFLVLEEINNIPDSPFHLIVNARDKSTAFIIQIIYFETFDLNLKMIYSKKKDLRRVMLTVTAN
jgi:hypothetical protein